MHGSGASKTFLDETSFPTEDDLSDFKFGKAYMNWLTLIEAVPEPVVESGWHAHHKHMVQVKASRIGPRLGKCMITCFIHFLC